MSLAEGLRAFKTKTSSHLDAVTTGTVEAVGERLIVLSPVGDPTTWTRPPSADYRPGHFRSNWFYSFDAQATPTTPRVDIHTVNGLDQVPAQAAGHRHFIQNSVEYAQALEYGHSDQAPAGIIAVIAIEMPDIALSVARRFQA